MTRAERLAQQEARAKEQLTQRRDKLAAIQREQRAEDKRLRLAWYRSIGAMAESAGLHLVDPALVAEAFVWLGTILRACPDDPAAAHVYLRCLQGGQAAKEMDKDSRCR